MTKDQQPVGMLTKLILVSLFPQKGTPLDSEFAVTRIAYENSLKLFLQLAAEMRPPYYDSVLYYLEAAFNADDPIDRRDNLQAAIEVLENARGK